MLDVADIVQDDTRVAVQLGQRLGQAQVSFGDQQLLHQRGRRGPQDGLALEDELVAKGGQQVALAYAGLTCGHNVDGVGDERAAAQVLQLLLDIQWEAIELQRAEGLIGW